jgi:hypothetical protein
MNRTLDRRSAGYRETGGSPWFQFYPAPRPLQASARDARSSNQIQTALLKALSPNTPTPALWRDAAALVRVLWGRSEVRL